MTDVQRRPTKVLWLLPIPKEGEHWSSVIPSKSVRALVKEYAQILQDSQIESQVLPLTQELYADWHAYYAEVMTAQQHDVIASPDWFQQKKDELPQIFLMDFRSKVTGKRVGASIISQNHEKVFTHHFKASQRVEIKGPPNTSLGLLIELFFVEYAYAQGAARVSAGLSRNGFGYFNTIGYLASKLRMGYIPIGAENRPWDNEFLRRGDNIPTAWFVKAAAPGLTLLLYPSSAAFQGEIMTYLQRLAIPYQDYTENNPEY